MDMDRLARYTDIAKNLAQILALIVAAVWTYLLFIRTEVPSLEFRANTSSSLEWHDLDSNRCIASFRVDHENTGRSSYDVAAYRWRVWEYAAPDSGKKIDYIDLQAIQDQAPLMERVVPDEERKAGPFITHYPPGTAFGHNFEWVVEKQPHRFLFFRLDLAVDGIKNKESWHTGSWGVACKDLTNKNPAQSNTVPFPGQAVQPPGYKRDRR
ncbi:hypothetical protein [Sulfuriflexus mobilis]|uniref:hypothetical protein n=1 Tax=Sulfuriflexus mobilis TaxID=1811807 RepID=UPI000F8247BD|nr:hypothetical protein [Sulfuriflexus mobilis]